jgi:hypothetical protein
MTRIHGIAIAAAAAIVCAFLACDPGTDHVQYSPTPLPSPFPASTGGGGGGGGGGAPTDTGGSAPCQNGVNFIHLHGAVGGTILNQSAGDLDLSAGTWDAGTLDVTTTGVETVWFKMLPTGASAAWYLNFSTKGTSTDLGAPADYNPAFDYRASDTYPGLGIYSDDNATKCDIYSGRVRIDDLTLLADGGIGSYTGSFLQFCGSNADDWLQGCIHYAP